MPVKIDSPKIISAAGNLPKVIEEYIGKVNSKTDNVSIARMKSPCAGLNPAKLPNSPNILFVLKGMLRVKTRNSVIDVKADRRSSRKK
jgi:hypothetical protein